MMHKINWDLLANIVTVLSFFSNCILDITTLEMRVNIHNDLCRLFLLLFYPCLRP